ncbi:unnamed protein product (macronuclear) [Paramecium tetraurelia]|uniref:RING-CH-type domain-containing protein n=1 Tax=Paramecium tetraurelia TaxID=5888 RepID=A0BFZ1_PARTE|nr:uncharacterized protein GSPATT00028493001 [Paramecium tetraurelia]CAK57458.1 unnamed protein product [Paramecium tetraurelia]|eukprot:XP_001424856.1 hypothetical protein (macronuclear) [Paramecium tetraurelia strain d4-2]
MFISETLTINQSPQHQLQTIEQSQQRIQPFENIQFGQMSKSTKIIPELKMRKVYLMKVWYNRVIQDKLRKKYVWLEMKINQYKEKDSILQDEMKFCRICLCDDGNSDLIRPCKCKGSLQFIHENCLKLWVLEKQGIEKVYQNDLDCEVCHSKFLMETKFSNQRQLRMLRSAPRARICCWTIEIIMSLGMLGTIIALIYQIVVRFKYYKIQNGKIEPLILAGTTIFVILLILILSLIYVSCVDQISIEVLDPWRFIDVQMESDSKSISILELDNSNKQTIQIINKSDQRNNVRFSTINIIQIQN